MDSNNINFINRKKLKPSKSSYLTPKYYKKNNPNNINSNTNDNINIRLLKEKINSQKSDIEYLENRLQNYDETINEITHLNLQINKLNEILKNKNKTILEYQNLSEISKAKFNNYINKTNEKKNKYLKNLENYDALQSQNKYLMEQIEMIDKENYTLKHQLNSIKNKNKYEIDNIRNEMDIINIEFEKEKKQNKLLNDDKINKNKEIIDLKTKLITYDKFKEEINNINNKYNLLEQQISEKDKQIQELTDINNDLKDKLEITNNNYNNAIYEHKNLEMKLNELMDKAKKYENMFNGKNFKNNNFNKSFNNFGYKKKNEKSYRNNYSSNNFPSNKNTFKSYNNMNIGRNSKTPDYIGNKSFY